MLVVAYCIRLIGISEAFPMLFFLTCYYIILSNKIVIGTILLDVLKLIKPHFNSATCLASTNTKLPHTKCRQEAELAKLGLKNFIQSF